MNDREFALAHFRRLGAHLAPRQIDGPPALGIQLRRCPIKDDDLAHLRQFRDELDVIGLEGTCITDDGLHHLLDSPKLHNVDLTDPAITDNGLAILARITTLEYSHVEGTAVPSAGVALLF